MGKATIAQARERKRKAVALFQSGKNFTEIAEAVGYTNKGTAYETVMRAIKRETQENVDEIRSAGTLAPEGKFLEAYGERWGSAGKSGLQCRLTLRKSDKDKHIGCGAQLGVNGDPYGMINGEIIELRAKVLKPADGWAWP